MRVILLEGLTLSTTKGPAWESLPKSFLTPVLLLLTALPAAAAPEREALLLGFPGYPETTLVRALKKKADALYDAGDYQRSLRYYSRRLAFYGDKYAHYMAGFQYLHGQGAPRNIPLAYAWYRLAAERGHGALIRVRDELGAQLSEHQQELAEDHFQELVAVYGDVRILERLIFQDRRAVRARTGSRVGANNGPLTVYTPDGPAADGASYYRRIEDRLATRIKVLELLRGKVEYGELQVIEPDSPAAAEPPPQAEPASP